MRSAIEVANWMILNRGDIELSNLKIQKLLYIAFGCHFADFNEHLFFDPIEAWKYGPVIGSLYHCLKFNGSETIKSAIVHPDGSVPMLDDSEADAIWTVSETLRVLGHNTASQLIQWTHTVGGPWELTYVREQGRIREIDKQLIRRAVLERNGWPVPRPRRFACFSSSRPKSDGQLPQTPRIGRS